MYEYLGGTIVSAARCSPPCLRSLWQAFSSKAMMRGALRRVRHRSKHLVQSWTTRQWLCCFAVLSGIWLGGTILFAIAVSNTGGILRHLVPRGVSLGVLILNVLVQGVQIASGVLGSGILDVLFWALLRSEPGHSFPVMLAISSTTGVLGLFQLLKWRTPIRSNIFRGWHILWIVLRYPQAFL